MADLEQYINMLLLGLHTYAELLNILQILKVQNVVFEEKPGQPNLDDLEMETSLNIWANKCRKPVVGKREQRAIQIFSRYILELFKIIEQPEGMEEEFYSETHVPFYPYETKGEECSSTALIPIVEYGEEEKLPHEAKDEYGAEDEMYQEEGEEEGIDKPVVPYAEEQEYEFGEEAEQLEDEQLDEEEGELDVREGDFKEEEGEFNLEEEEFWEGDEETTKTQDKFKEVQEEDYEEQGEEYGSERDFDEQQQYTEELDEYSEGELEWKPSSAAGRLTEEFEGSEEGDIIELFDHPKEVLEHTKGTICCASLKKYAEWLQLQAAFLESLSLRYKQAMKILKVLGEYKKLFGEEKDDRDKLTAVEDKFHTLMNILETIRNMCRH